MNARKCVSSRDTLNPKPSLLPQAPPGREFRLLSAVGKGPAKKEEEAKTQNKQSIYADHEVTLVTTGLYWLPSLACAACDAWDPLERSSRCGNPESLKPRAPCNEPSCNRERERERERQRGREREGSSQCLNHRNQDLLKMSPFSKSAVSR